MGEIKKEVLDPRPPPCIPPRRPAPFAMGGTFTHETKKLNNKCGMYTAEQQVDAYKFAKGTAQMGLARARGTSRILDQTPSEAAEKPSTRTSAGAVGALSAEGIDAYKECRRTARSIEKARGGGNPLKWSEGKEAREPLRSGRGSGGGQTRNNTQVRPRPSKE